MTARLKQSHLTVYFSGRCNLRCLYCYAASAPAEATSDGRLLGALDFFLAQGPTSKKITFLGGEPLLHGRLLKRAVLRIRAAGADIPVRVFTNATLLDRGWLSFFFRHRVKLTISLDGGKASTDAFRRFRTGKASVFAAVLRHLPPAARAAATVNMVVSPVNAGELAANILRLQALGFRSIGWAPDITVNWSGGDLARLKRAAQQVKRHYFSFLAKGFAPYEIANIYEALKRALTGERIPACSNLTLGPDGGFYPCDKLLAAPAADRRRFAMGIRGDRLELSGRKKFFAAAARDGSRSGGGVCSAGTWALARFRPGGGRAAALALRAGQKALNDLASGWLAAMAAEGLTHAAFRLAHSVAAEGKSRGGHL